jgi:hypothetical protein
VHFAHLLDTVEHGSIMRERLFSSAAQGKMQKVHLSLWRKHFETFSRTASNR